MTEITLQKHRRTVWHFIPGLALSAVITGAALWGGAIPAVAGAGFSALTLAILLGMVIGNTVYPQIWKQCDGGVLFAKQHLLRLGIILYGFRLTFSQIADVGISGIVIDVLTLSSTFMLACFFRPESLWSGQAHQLADWRRQQYLRRGGGTGDRTGGKSGSQ
ncbi:Putative membrane protein YeiH [Salmonella enterica subsp. arizonae]|uniref:Membrane protein YeiH n=1 Tax=Salmonella enterica subsp. arizonae TaxID=59203 RepID=A0A2X4WGM4_SALER|nr:Putative membrane protein YeiH [Salmonella enterica subsp. arizonae]